MTSFVVLVLLALVGTAAMAETAFTTQTVSVAVNEVAEISVSASPGDLVLDNPTTGGAVPPAATDASTYVRYTSIVATGLARTIAAKISGGTMPVGTKLGLVATTATGGSGNVGTATAGTDKLLATDTTILSGIGSCATGTEATNGAKLTYTLAVDAWTGLIIAAATPITVTLTVGEGA